MNLIKKMVLGVTTFALAVIPVATNAQNNVRIESNIGVANVTAGDTTYKDSVNAKIGEVVKVQVWYHNMEDDDSGLVANDLKVKIDLPTQPGKTQTIRSTVSGTNTNTVTDTANVNLSVDRAFLEYIPGSALWRHNAGTNANPNYVTQSISDNVVKGGTGVVLEDAKPCFNFEATVTILARVKAPIVSIDKFVRKVGETEWKVENSAKPGETLEYQIRFKNEGNTVLNDVIVGDNLPASVTYVPGSTVLRNSNHPNGITVTNDNVTKGGIFVGDYGPGGVGYVLFKAKVKDIPCGTRRVENIGIVRPEGMNDVFNRAFTTITKPCGGGELPKQPKEIPETGAAGAAAGMVGFSALGYVTRAWIRSKRELLEALKR